MGNRYQRLRDARFAIAELEDLVTLGVSGGVLVGAKMRTEAYRAMRDGVAVMPVVRGFRGRFHSFLTDAMVAGHILGRWRTIQRGVKAYREKFKGLGVYDDTVAYLKTKSELSDDAVWLLRRQYGDIAFDVTKGLGDVVEKKAQKAVERIVKEGMHVKEGIGELRKAFDAAGIVPNHKGLLENLVRTNIQLSYGAAKWQANQSPMIDSILWGYEYWTAGDERVRENHAALEGTKLPKNDPRWSSIWPPNGYQCRCQAIEIYDAERKVSPPVEGMPDKGWEFNAGEVYGKMGARLADPTGIEEQAKNLSGKIVRDFNKSNRVAMKSYKPNAWGKSQYDEAMMFESAEAKDMLRRLGMRREDVMEHITKSREAFDRGISTKAKWYDTKTALWDKKRYALHDEIAEKFLGAVESASVESPTLLMTGGLPGSGKSSMLKIAYPDFNKRFVHVDSDEIKMLLARADGLSSLGYRAGLYQDEADNVIEMILRRAVRDRKHVLFDGTLKNHKKILKMIEDYREAGYGIEMAFAELPMQRAMERAIARSLGKSDRFVDPLYIATHGKRNLETYEIVKELVDDYVKYDTDVKRGTMPRLKDAKRRRR